MGNDGKFVRKPTTFRNTIEEGESGRYSLYVSLACPWAHRCLIFRSLKGLEKAIDVHVVHPVWGEVIEGEPTKSWVFGKVHGEKEFGGVRVEDGEYGSRALWHLYRLGDPNYEGKTTVPVLWDKQDKKIVNNESSEIIRMLNSAFNKVAESPEIDLFPEALSQEIQEVDERMYESYNNGVYRAGFARTQEAHQAGATAVFEYLEWAEARLADGRKYLLGDTLTESDVRMFVTTVRFDPVYLVHFKCSLKAIKEYPNISAWLERMLANEKIRKTVNYPHIKHHYYRSHPALNPYGLVPHTSHDDDEVGTL